MARPAASYRARRRNLWRHLKRDWRLGRLTQFHPSGFRLGMHASLVGMPKETAPAA